MTSGLTIAIMLVITIGAAVYVAWPLLMGGDRAEEFLGEEPSEPVLQRLAFQRDATYAAMKELEFDRAAGNLSQEDFEQIYGRYKNKAIALLKRIDDARAGKLSARELAAAEDEFDMGRPGPVPGRAAPASSKTDLDVEEEIDAFRRRSRAASSGDRATGRGPGPAAGRAGFTPCPSCGRQVSDADAKFCPKCGTPLGRGERNGRAGTTDQRRRRDR